VEFSSHLCFTIFPTPGCWVGAAAPAFSGWFVYLQFHEGLPLPFSALRVPCPFAICLFCFCCLLFRFFFFFPWVGVSLSRALC
jgi:hypothetical protein